jgi:uncharacterized membrane protein (DUF106 family)
MRIVLSSSSSFNVCVCLCCIIIIFLWAEHKQFFVKTEILRIRHKIYFKDFFIRLWMGRVDEKFYETLKYWMSLNKTCQDLFYDDNDF